MPKFRINRVETLTWERVVEADDEEAAVEMSYDATGDSSDWTLADMDVTGTSFAELVDAEEEPS